MEGRWGGVGLEHAVSNCFRSDPSDPQILEGVSLAHTLQDSYLHFFQKLLDTMSVNQFACKNMRSYVALAATLNM